MTFVAVRCPHCESEPVVKRGKTHRGPQHYLCQKTGGTRGRLSLAYRTRGVCRR